MIRFLHLTFSCIFSSLKTSHAFTSLTLQLFLHSCFLYHILFPLSSSFFPATSLHFTVLLSFHFSIFFYFPFRPVLLILTSRFLHLTFFSMSHSSDNFLRNSDLKWVKTRKSGTSQTQSSPFKGTISLFFLSYTLFSLFFIHFYLCPFIFILLSLIFLPIPSFATSFLSLFSIPIAISFSLNLTFSLILPF